MAVTQNFCDAQLIKHLSMECSVPLTKGMQRKGYIIHRDDIDFAKCTLSEWNNNRYTTIALKKGKKWWRIVQPSNTPFAGTNTELVKGTYRNTYTHTVSFVVLDAGYNTAKNIDALADGEFVVVLELNQPKTEKNFSCWQVFGMDNGLRADTIKREPWSDETMQGFGVTLQETGSTRSITYLGVDDGDVLELTRAVLEANTNQ